MGDGEKLTSRIKFSASPQASLAPPTLPLPRVLSGSFSTPRGSALKFGSDSSTPREADSSGWGWSPAENSGTAGKEAATRARMPKGGRGRPEEGSWGGPAHPGRRAQSPGPGLPRPSRLRLRTLSGY